MKTDVFLRHFAFGAFLLVGIVIPALALLGSFVLVPWLLQEGSIDEAQSVALNYYGIFVATLFGMVGGVIGRAGILTRK